MKRKLVEHTKIYFKVILVIIILIVSIIFILFYILGLNNIYLTSDFDIINALTYLIGYTDLSAYSNTAKLLKLLLALLGLFATAFFSSILTMYCVKSNKAITLSECLSIEKNNNPANTSGYRALIKIKSGWSDLYQICATFILYSNAGIISESEVKKTSYLQCKENNSLYFDLSYNDPIFQYTFFKLNNLYTNLSLICYVNYVSEYSGEQYHFCKEYTLKSFTYRETNKDVFENKVKSRKWNIRLDTFVPILSDIHNSKICRPKTNAFHHQWIKGAFDTNCVQWSFAMVLIRLPFAGNWLFFYDNDCRLEFKIHHKKFSHLRLEIKNELQQHILDPSDQKYNLKSENYSFRIRELNSNRNSWGKVLELCFTVFNRNPKQVNNQIQEFCYSISNLRMVFPQNDHQEGRS